MNDGVHGTEMTNDPLQGGVTEQETAAEPPVPRGFGEVADGADASGTVRSVDLDQRHVDIIVAGVSGGGENVQDIYLLSPMQESMLFQHLIDERSDTYVLSTLFELASQAHVRDLIIGLQKVIDRHDALRTAVVWEGLPRPVQVVCRSATLPVEELRLSPKRDAVEQLKDRMGDSQQMDLRRAPLMRLQIAEIGGCWYALIQRHHIVFDHQSWSIAFAEAIACMQGHERELPTPLAYKEHVAKSLAQAQVADAKAFFRRKLGDVEEPTAPFGLLETGADDEATIEAREELDPTLARRVRDQGQVLGVSAARLFHAAWALVVAATSGRTDVVFGTVVSGRYPHAKRMIGLFVNTLPLRLQLGNATAKELVEHTHRELTELLNYQQASPAMFRSCSGLADHASLFSAVLNYRRSAGHSVVDPAARTAGLRLVAQHYRTSFPIMLVVDDLGDGFTLTSQTRRLADPKKILDYMTTALASLIQALESHPQTLARALSLLPQGERKQVIQGFNDTNAEYGRGGLVHQLFEEQATRTPNTIAVTYEEQELTYAALNSRADKVARKLAQLGAGPGDLVALCIERGVDMVVGLLGILKAGAAYLPLDPNYPAVRLQYMLNDADPRVVLTQESLRATVSTARGKVLSIDTAQISENTTNVEVPGITISPKSLVYVIYTSGTTGRPKGTAMAHSSMVNLIEWHRHNLHLREEQRVLQFAALSFDVAFQEIFSTLASGGTLVLLDEWIRRDVRALMEFIDARSIERLFVPPLMLQSLAEYSSNAGLAPKALREVITAGEQLRISPEITSFFRNLPDCRLHNHYGPTETHVVTSLTLGESPGEWPSLPTIGRPISNAQIYILDAHMQPIPVGVVGEIYVGGANVARGYLNRPQLTAERFVVDPFDSHGRLYRTGDLGRWRLDGTIEYLGRNDQQVKIRGFRIELGEIEAQLARHMQVKESVVVVREDSPGEIRLVAYFTPRTSHVPNSEELRQHLQEGLPEHMVPSAFVLLQVLPLTPSGKLDRRALPAPSVGAYASHQYEAPDGEIEQILARIWGQLLRVHCVGRHDNFFALGGHSLLLVQMMERLRQARLSVSVRSIYENRTLEALARTIIRSEIVGSQVPASLIPEGCREIFPHMLPLVDLELEQIRHIVRQVPGNAANIQDIYPLAPLQEGILFHHIADRRGTDTYIVSMLLRMPSRQRLNEFAVAFQKVIDRHDILRTAILWESLPRAVQVVYRHVSLPVEEVMVERGCDPLEQAKGLMQSARQRLNVLEAPLIRLLVIADESGSQMYAVLQLHHLLCDHESLDAMLIEVLASMRGRAGELPEPMSYRNHVAQALAYAKEHDAESFFRTKLQDVDEPTAPLGLMDVHGSGDRISRVERNLDHHLAKRLRAQARRLGVSAATLFHVVWALVVSHTSGRNDVVFGTVLLGRLQGSAGARRTIGLFMNTLPLRLQLLGVTAGELVERTQRELVDLLSYEQASLAVAQRCSGVESSVPLFSALLNYRWSTVDLASEFASVGISRLGIQSHSNYPITLSVLDQGEAFLLETQTERRVDPHRVMEYVTTATQSLLDALGRTPESLALDLSVIPESERIQMIEEFNATGVSYNKAILIHELFEEQVERTPDGVALTCGEQQLTYRQLNCEANKLAHALIAVGVGPDERAAIYLERSAEMIIALLAVLKAGGAYVPIDVNYPPERMEYMLADSKPLVLLTQEELRSAASVPDIRVLKLDADRDEIDRRSTRNPEPGRVGLRSSQLAYVIYTSGSTGTPKGVMVDHCNVINLVHWHCTAFSLTRGARSSSVASVGFDAAGWEIWPPLCVGATLVLAPQNAANNADALLAWWARQYFDVSFLPTPLAEIALSRNLARAQLSTLLVGGDRLRYRPGLEPFSLINNYGPTETTVVATSGRIYDSDAVLHIGRPISNTRIYILSRDLKLVPIGVVGEIYIGGVGVARGYLHRPELTAQRFLCDPFSGEPSMRMYRTGDLGRWCANGTIEYIGRNDRQVKIRGFRIEPGEIEAQLMASAQVEEVAVIEWEDLPGDKRLVAYIVPKDPRRDLNTEELCRRLRATLPEYMVPSAFLVIDALPLTPNGKLDRRALPAPDRLGRTGREYEAPQGELEEILAGIWEGILRVERVGRRDNFFALGGHSLLIVQMMERLRRLRLSADVRTVFEKPALSDLASALTAVEHFEVPPNLIPAACSVITPEMLTLLDLEAEPIEQIVQTVPGGAANIQDIYPLAPLQEGILFHHLLNEHAADVYVVPILLRISSRARLDELIGALQQVIDRHDVLRTAVLWDRLPQPVQVVYRRATLPVGEITLASDLDPITQVMSWLKPERQRLDLQAAPLIRLQVARDGSGQWYAFLQLHHIAVDGQSMQLVTSEVVEHLEGRAQKLPPSVPYRNHVAQTREYADKHDATAFFRAKLGDIEQPIAPFEIFDVYEDGSQIKEEHCQLELSLARRVRMQARRLGLSAATVFHAAWALVVAHTSGQDDIVFGTVLLGRLHGNAGAQRILGMFINTLPIRLQLRGASARDLVEQTQRELIELLNHEQTSLAVAQRCSGVSGSAPLFTTLLNYRHSARVRDADWIQAEGIELIARRGLTNYPITLSVDDLEEGFNLTAQTDRRIDPGRVAQYMHSALLSLIEALEQAPEVSALTLSILRGVEHHEVVHLLNDTRTALAQGKLVHGLFEEQVRLGPSDVAVMYEDQSLTYIELNSRANQLARYLRGKGVRAGEVVGICVQRGFEMVVGLLGILKVGGAYLPLDPSLPAERLLHMLKDAAPRLVLTQEKLTARLPATSADIVVLDAQSPEMNRHAAANLDSTGPGITPQSPVYVIYTSGSTGRPKGTAMAHGAMVNLIEWHRSVVGSKPKPRVLQFATLSFDVAFQEIFSTLCTGGTLVLINEWTRKDVKELAEALSERSVERLFVPPLMLQSLAEYFATTSALPETLQDVITAGEQLRVTAEVADLFGRLNRCRLHNHYGPTETHVVTALTLTGDSATWPALPAAGRPIANTEIYILNAWGQPVPRGVVGEIYVGGAGVALGYSNRPELTAERFIADPFGSKPGSRLYRTGDLGRWEADGALAYIGRNDDQVKIRGYRVELGEIESQLARHERLRNVAVVAREDVTGERRLVAYVTPRGESCPTAEQLRAHLQGMLPEYMIPSAFVVLDDLPLTSTGKLNRRLLPAPDSASFVNQGYAAPQGPVEEKLAGIWQGLLHVDRVGREDNFFEIGGHSLLVLKALFNVNRTFASNLRVVDVYNSPKLKELANLLSGEVVSERPVELSKEATLDDDIVAIPGDLAASAETVLLTGGTGFVGRFVLAHLLEQTSAKIYCLVRASSKREAFGRVRAMLIKWDLWREDWRSRIDAIPGDLRQSNLGLDDQTYYVLTQVVGRIYHCATSMNHLETYSMAKSANVDSVQMLLRLSTQGQPKQINYLSTFAVFRPSHLGTTRVVEEATSIDHERHLQSAGYAASKWVAEKIFMMASARGIPCNIFRLGLVWGDTKAGRYDEAQRIYRVIKSCFLSGYGIRGYRFVTPPAPVDYVARAVVSLADLHPKGGGIFHIPAPTDFVIDVFERCNQVLGTSLELLSYHDWINQIKRIHFEGRTLPIVPLIESEFSMDEESFLEHQRRNRSDGIRFSCDRTRDELERAGIVVPALNDDLLRSCMGSMLSRDGDLRGMAEDADDQILMP